MLYICFYIVASTMVHSGGQHKITLIFATLCPLHNIHQTLATLDINRVYLLRKLSDQLNYITSIDFKLELPIRCVLYTWYT